MSNVVSINRRERRVRAALSKRDGSTVEGLKKRLAELRDEYANTQMMFLAVVRQAGRIRVDHEHLVSLKEGDHVDAEKDDRGNVVLNFRG